MKQEKHMAGKRQVNVMIAVLVGLIVVASGYMLLSTTASGFFASLDADQGTVAGNAQLINDTSAAGGKAIKFSAPATPPPGGGGGGGGGGGTTTPPPPSGSSCTTYTSTTTFAQCGFPTASTTGVSAGVTLGAQETTGTSGMVITQEGQTIQKRTIKGYLDIRVNNVTIQDNLIYGTSWSTIKVASGVTGLRILHNKIVGTPEGGAQTDYCINQTGSGFIEVAYNDISNCKDGVVGVSLDVHDNYVHDLRLYSGAHTQDIYIYAGGTGVTVTHNTLINQLDRGPGDSGPTAAIYIAPDDPNQKNHKIQNNWLAGGAFTFYGGDSNSSNIKLLNNVFSTEIFPPTGSLYGPIAYWSNNSGNVASGNVWGNGSKAGQAVNP